MPDDIGEKFNSISPSALALLESRSFTSIPFARESYRIVSLSNSNQTGDKKKLPGDSLNISRFNFGLKNDDQLPQDIIMRIMHFETRYLSIDKGIREVGYNNVLEFSSGLSLRGLDLCNNPDVLYIDTDLPEIIEIKRKLLHEILQKHGGYRPDNLFLSSMNALDAEEFFDTLAIFKRGPITLVNEGFLMYLNMEQKVKLSKIIHQILSRYGGYWITADIYQRDEVERRNIDKYYNQNDKEFVKRHNIENNKFSSFTEAADFFSRCGFEIHDKVEIERNELSTSELLHENYPSAINETVREKKNRETWILRPINS
jgi:O-methyltransferase involved in polyketide biosynthesis